MTPELYQKVARAFDQADELDGSARAEYLRQMRHAEPEVAAEVEKLLSQQETPDSLEPLPTHMWDKLQTPESPRWTAAAPVDEALTQIAGYVVEGERLGRGGMGDVLRVRDPKFNRPLALKLLRVEHQHNADLKKRFLEEAQIIGQLQHPGIPPVHDLGHLPDGRPFFVMKLIKGQTLAALLQHAAASREQPPASREQPPASRVASAPGADQGANASRSLQDLPRLLNIFEQVCQTIAYAHSRDIIHRDLKPGNIMAGAFGEVQVMDWGLAKIIAPASGSRQLSVTDTEPASTIYTVRLSEPGSGTQAGQAMGTPAYMAPEQARGEIENLDQRCDVFGLGAILCELLTGKPAYAAASSQDNHRLAMKGDLTNAQARLESCGADQELVALARRCLAPDKDERPTNAGAVAAAMAAYQAAVQERLRQAEREQAAAEARAEEEQKRRVVEQAKVAEERKRRRMTVALAALSSLFVLTIGAGFFWVMQEETRRHIEASEKLAQTSQQIRLASEQARKMHDSLQTQLRKPGGVFLFLDEPFRWRELMNEARTALTRAQTLHRQAKEELDQQLAIDLQLLDGLLQQDKRDYDLATELDKLRLDRAGTVGTHTVALEGEAGKGEGKSEEGNAPFDKSHGKLAGGTIFISRSKLATTGVQNVYRYPDANKEYTQLFLQANLRMDTDADAEIAVQIGKSPIKQQLVAALDDWAMVVWEKQKAKTKKTTGEQTEALARLHDHLLKMARLIEPDPWFDELRTAAIWSNRVSLEVLAKNIKQTLNKHEPGSKLSAQLLHLGVCPIIAPLSAMGVLDLS